MFFINILTFVAVFIQVADGQCRQDWLSYGGTCYVYGESRVTFAAALEICKMHSAHLVEIESAGENSFVKNVAKNRSAEMIWLGGTDIFDEGNWVWLHSGQKIFDFLDWAPGQPDETGTGEDCLTIWNGTNYHWNDESCSYSANFVCESDQGMMFNGRGRMQDADYNGPCFCDESEE